jgi:alanine-glyoxylate transaminase/serine-glyoxylate transaminase/serine-pyruvate transaminase
MSFNAISDKALAANKTSKLTKSFWAWDEMLTMNKVGFFPYTPATQMLQGLAVSIEMLHEEGLDNVFARHDRLAEATRRAIKTWGLETICREPKYYSPCCCRTATTPRHSARWRSSNSIFRTARASAVSPARCSASGISATSMTR